MNLSPEVEAIRERLNQLSALLIDLVCEQAEQNPVLRKSLMPIFGIKSKKKPTRSNYDLFGRFRELNHDFEALSNELTEKEHDELVLIATTNKLSKKKELTAMDNNTLVEKLIQYVRGTIKSWSHGDSPTTPVETQETDDVSHE